MGVVAALDPHVGFEPGEQGLGGVLVEDGDGVHAFQGAQHADPVGERVDGPSLALAAAHGGVGVDADDEAVADAPGRLEQSDVARVQEVEAAPGGDDRAAGGPDVGEEPLGLAGGGVRPGRSRRAAGAFGTGGPAAAPAVRAFEPAVSQRSPPAPPAPTKAQAVVTAPCTASSVAAPSARSPAAVAANRSPAPQLSPPCASGAGTSSGKSP